MEIKNIKKVNKNGVAATGTVVMDSEVFINNIEILEGENGLFFNMPGQSYKDENGEWKTNYYAVPVSSEARNEILEIIKKAYAEDKYRKVSSSKRPNLKGYINIKAKNVSIRVLYTEIGNVFTPSETYEKDGETKYAHFVNIDAKQAKEIAEAFKKALA